MQIALLGYGKMGKTIEGVIQEINAAEGGQVHEVCLKIDKNNLQELTTENLKKADVAIEFSTPETAVDNILKCFEAGTPVVSGTTGWTDRMEEVKRICKDKNATFFYASNFSVGVNLFFELSRQLARMMDSQEQYDVSLHEIHHNQKLDAPSGTGISLADDVVALLRRKKRWVKGAAQSPEDLGVHSYREGDVAGIHILNYESELDSIEIKHTAHSRKGFAKGAVMAAEWVADKKGVFGMKDLLQL